MNIILRREIVFNHSPLILLKYAETFFSTSARNLSFCRQSQTDQRPSMVASSADSKPLTNDIKINHRILSLETKVHSLAKKNKEQKTERIELNKEEVKNMECKISSLRELIETFMEFQSKRKTEIACGKRDVEDSARKVVRLENIRDDYRNVSQEQFLAEMNRNSKRVNAVSTNVSNACRSLSIGLNDVHKVALDLVNWSDEVHNAFAIISEKLFLSRNLCPRFYPSLRRVSSPFDNSPT